MFWKPYFLFSKGLHKSVWIYWRGMFPYYTIFLLFTILALLLRHVVIEPEATTMPRLAGYAIITYTPLILLYFLTLSIATRGMKYFIARKPSIYNKMKFLRKEKVEETLGNNRNNC